MLNLIEALKILEDNGYIISEDFSIGVGSPAGLDQGIPLEGDCKGCYPQYMGLYKRHSLFNELNASHQANYWTKQVKNRKHKRNKKHKINNNLIKHNKDLK